MVRSGTTSVVVDAVAVGQVAAREHIRRVSAREHELNGLGNDCVEHGCAHDGRCGADPLVETIERYARVTGLTTVVEDDVDDLVQARPSALPSLRRRLHAGCW